MLDNSEAREEDVRRVLTEEEVMRWKWLREKRDIDRGTYKFSGLFIALPQSKSHP